MAESKLVQLNLENSSYNKAWPHSDIRSSCRQSLHRFAFRFDSTLLGYTSFTCNYTEGIFA